MTSTNKTNKGLAGRHHRNYRIIIAVLVVLVLISGLSAFFLKRDKQESDQKLAAEKPAISTQDATETTPSEVATDNAKETSSELSEKEEPAAAAPIAFVDTKGWKQVSSKDGAYKVSLSDYVTYGSCKNNTSVLLVGMIFLDGTGEYTCDGITDALTADNPQLTRIAFGVNSDTDKPQGASTTSATLANGVNATRYEYVSTEKGQKYNNIKYVATKGGSQYVAHMRWLVSYNIYGGSDAFTAPPVFDTIVQKTWIF